MTREEWLRIKAVAGEALALPEPDRQAWIATACAGDEALRREVQSLVEASTSASSLFEAPPLPIRGVLTLIEAAGSNAAIGRRIGAYRVIGEIGRGGMGAAYLAERADDAFQKRVAIKLIKRGMDTDAILRRFRHERQILAGLSHPNIAMLLDGGTTDDGLPYFVMEYVDGQPIDVYCHERRLSIADRLRLFAAVCGAVHYAHEMRVVHRDLKPSNILVTTRGVPKLLDFGIAKLLDAQEGATVEPTALARAMTPSYASPEQILGRPVTPASDIYSLGVLLYELLSGSRPYALEGQTIAEIERLVCYADPPPPSQAIDLDASLARGAVLEQVRGEVAGALDVITLTALDKEPRERYPTAQALADDIERHLGGRPILARRRLGHRLASFVQRRSRRDDPSRRTRVAAWTLVAMLAIVIAAAVAFTRRTPTQPSAHGASTTEPIDSIAVLPLANSAGDTNLDYLSEGIAEHVITRLSNTPRLRVIARDSAFRYRGPHVDPAQVGRILGVRAVLEGTIVQHDQALAVSARLIDTRDGREVWRERYERAVTDVQQLQADLAQDIAGSLRLRLSDAEQARFAVPYTASPEAYQLYLKGRYFWNRRTPADLQKSVGYFQRATELDPQFALAFSGLADSHGVLTEYHAANATDTYAAARRAADRALAIDPRLAEAHTSLAYIRQFYEWDFPSAEREFRRAIELNPRYPTAHQWFAEYLTAMGRFDEAIAEIQLAAELDPLSLIVNSSQAYILYMARRYDESIEQCRRVLDMEPNFAEAVDYLKRAYDQKGMYRESVEMRQRRRRILGLEDHLTPPLRAAAAASTPREYWRRRVEQELIESRTEGLLPFEFAELLAQAGEHDRALEWIEKACAQHDFLSMYIRVTPNLDSVRSDPRYLAILQRSCAVEHQE
jgi:serine/threonine protein kinase/tetratricopeptide (TPR) repeat protein